MHIFIFNNTINRLILQLSAFEREYCVENDVHTCRPLCVCVCVFVCVCIGMALLRDQFALCHKFEMSFIVGFDKPIAIYFLCYAVDDLIGRNCEQKWMNHRQCKCCHN